MIGALAVTTQYAISEVHPLTPKDRPAIPVGFCRGDDHLKQIAKLAGPSVIAIVSISGTFLRTWHALFASAIGKEHTVVEYPAAAGRTRTRCCGLGALRFNRHAISAPSASHPLSGDRSRVAPIRLYGDAVLSAAVAAPSPFTAVCK